MSNYTTKIKDLCEAEIPGREAVEDIFKSYELSDFLTDEQIETITTNGVWSKDKLARKIVNHYYMREIGFETYGLFKHQAKILMEEIMEKYLPLIYSRAIEYDPLVNVDYTETFERTASGEGTTESNGDGTSFNSITPNVGLEQIKQGKYMSSANVSETNATGGDTFSNNEEYTKRVKGNSGVSATAQKMVEQFRQNIMAIDKDIIEELDILFMRIY